MLVISRQHLNRKKFDGEYFELHHIIPKSLGGSNKKSNLVLLTAKEHFIAHLLLFKMHTGKDKAKMANALFKMCSNNPSQQRQFNARYYEFSKRMLSQYQSGENSTFFGKKHSTETLRKQSESKIGNKNPAFGKVPWNKGLTKDTSESMKKISEKQQERYKDTTHRVGKKHSEETKQKLSKLHHGIPKSPEHKEKLSLANQGKTISESAKEKMSKKLKGRKKPTDICPHCNKEMSVGTLNRWHNNNCKFNPQVSSLKS
jgi:uncharacterized protein YlaI